MKKKWLSATLNFLLPGLGYFYLSELRKGIIILIIYIVSLLLAPIIIGLFSMIVVWLYSILHAYKFTDTVNERYQIAIGAKNV